MRKIDLLVLCAALSGGASASTDCTQMTPMRTGRPTSVIDVPANGGRAALMGCNEGYVDLVMPGIGSFSWSAVQAPDFFLLLWREQLDADDVRRKNILDCWERYDVCRKSAESFLAAGQTSCAQAKITIGTSWSAEGSGGSIGSSVSLERAAPSEYGRCVRDLGVEIMKMRSECTAIAQRCNGM